MFWWRGDLRVGLSIRQTYRRSSTCSDGGETWGSGWGSDTLTEESVHVLMEGRPDGWVEDQTHLPKNRYMFWWRGYLRVGLRIRHTYRRIGTCSDGGETWESGWGSDRLTEESVHVLMEGRPESRVEDQIDLPKNRYMFWWRGDLRVGLRIRHTYRRIGTCSDGGETWESGWGSDRLTEESVHVLVDGRPEGRVDPLHQNMYRFFGKSIWSSTRLSGLPSIRTCTDSSVSLSDPQPDSQVSPPSEHVPILR